MNKIYFFLILILSVVFIPSFGALDKANTQWVFLGIIPALFFYGSFKFFKSSTLYVYAFFILQALISILYSSNFSVSIVDFSRHFVLFSSIIIFLSLLQSKPFSFYNICFIISCFLIYEVAVSLFPLFSFIYKNGFNFSIIDSIDVDSLKGVTGNRNITTASIVIKIPFLFHLVVNSNFYKRLFFSFFSVLPIISLFLINSRAALLSFIFIAFVFLISILMYKKRKLISSLLLSIPIILSFLIVKFIVPDNNSDTVERLSSITFSNESSSQRFFLWENAIDFISKNPLIGSGIGTWKVESSFYWGTYGYNYLVPFHAHNDFLEFSTELGILGGLTYLLLFFLMLFRSSFLFLKTKSSKFLVIFLSSVALFVDSFLNFPFERPIIQVMFCLLLALIIFYENNTVKKSL